ncbi:MAG TPA: helix-turn-helix domain-containing protein [Gaiellaceae bacterium]|jgi:hypothetical protein|nr:helix-turn-helix domain-containing protein [Gaiellaceae bacterium]
MFEIGNSLHEARVRQGLGLPTAESATKIRAKYLKALEEEQFQLLPAATYVKGFLRTYAEYLGLDGQLYVDEFSSRFVAGEDEGRPLRPRRSSVRPQRRSRGLESGVVLVTLASIAIVAALVIVAWKSGDSNRHVDSLTPAAPATGSTTTHRAPREPTTARLVLSAWGGDTLLEVHAGSAAGKLLFQGTLLRGKSVPLEAKRLWLTVGTPKHLRATLNGHPISLGTGGKERVVLVTSHSIDAAQAG